MCGGNLRVVTKNRRSVLYACDREGSRVAPRLRSMSLRAVVIERLSRPNALRWLQGDDEARRLRLTPQLPCGPG